MKSENRSQQELIDQNVELRKRIQQLEQSEKTARERSDFLQEILDSVNLTIQVGDPSGVVLFVNRCFENHSGFRKEEVLGKRVADYFAPEDVAKLSKISAELLNLPDGTHRTFVMRVQDSTGTYHTLESFLVKKFRPPIGGFVGVSYDVTDRVNAESAHKESLEALSAVFNSVQDAILVHNASGEIVHLNDKMLQMFGMTRFEWAWGQRTHDAVSYYGPIDDSTDLPTVWNEVLSGETKQFEWRVRGPVTGKEFDAEIFMRKIHLQGKACILASIRDVTEKKRTANELLRALALADQLRKKAEAASAAKSEFLTNMSHELRSPLTAIIGFSELLSDQWAGKLNDKQLEYVTEVFSAGHHLLQLINDILDLAKVEAGKMDLRTSRVTLLGFFTTARA